MSIAGLSPLVGRNETLTTIIETMGAAQKSNRGAPGYSRWINRPVGRRLGAVAFKCGAAPNQVTALSATLSLAGIVVLATAPPTITVGLLVAALLIVGYGFDAADGQLARLRGGGSPAGEWLDHIVDCIKLSLLHVAVLVTWFRSFELADSALLVPLIFGAEAAVFFFTIILNDKLRSSVISDQPTPVPATAEAAPVLRSLAVLPTDYGVLCIIFVMLGFHAIFFWAYTAMMVANVLFLVLALPKWYREMRSLGRPVSAATGTAR